MTKEQGTLGAADIIERLLGFRHEPTRSAEVEAAVRERAKRLGLADLSQYAALLESDPVQCRAEAQALADWVTVNETYFFRERQHQAVLTECVVPALQARGLMPLRVLSVGCSTGEEPYSIALTLLSHGLRPGDVQILALDVSPAAIARARRGAFSEWSLRNLPEELRARYFVRGKQGYMLSEAVRRAVHFEVRNVLDPDEQLWSPSSFHVIFCRNVLIYLTVSAIRTLMARFYECLVPGGALFLGHSETGHANGAGFCVRQAHGSFYFERPVQEGSAPRSPAPVARRPANLTQGWASAIEQSAARVVQLHQRSGSSGSAKEPPSGNVGAQDKLLELLREERFAEALAALPRAGQVTEADLVRAAILTNQGEIGDARALCEALLVTDPTSAPCHYLLGLCREQTGALSEAQQHHLRSAALDLDFAMPRLRGGMLARRAGERALAVRLLREALHLFPHQPERVSLLFGGGFKAEALLQLCRAELSAAGGEP